MKREAAATNAERIIGEEWRRLEQTAPLQLGMDEARGGLPVAGCISLGALFYLHPSAKGGKIPLCCAHSEFRIPVTSAK